MEDPAVFKVQPARPCPVGVTLGFTSHNIPSDLGV